MTKCKERLRAFVCVVDKPTKERKSATKINLEKANDDIENTK